MSDPRAVLGEYGMNVPDGIDVNVVENNDSAVHINLPTPPVEQPRVEQPRTPTPSSPGHPPPQLRTP